MRSRPLVKAECGMGDVRALRGAEECATILTCPMLQKLQWSDGNPGKVETIDK